jgi:hypothetical protein
MRARIMQYDDGSIEPSIEHDGLTADCPSEWSPVDFVIPARTIPVIAHKYCVAPLGRRMGSQEG